MENWVKNHPRKEGSGLPKNLPFNPNNKQLASQIMRMTRALRKIEDDSLRASIVKTFFHFIKTYTQMNKKFKQQKTRV